MSEEFTNVLVRMSLDLKGRLQREAFINGRKLTGEINVRLEASLKGHKAGDSDTPQYIVSETSTNGPEGPLSGTDQAMLEIFRKLPPEKQLALLSLFR
jgi:hypothetical protein